MVRQSMNTQTGDNPLEDMMVRLGPVHGSLCFNPMFSGYYALLENQIA